MNAIYFSDPSGRDNFDTAGFLIAAAIGALISVVSIGFVFGIENNVYHLPIVGAIYEEPQFAQDPFIQSLRFYASGLWLLLRGVDRHVDPYWLFLALHYLSRFLAFVGFLACADLLGVRSRKERALFAGLLCLTALLRVTSYAGNGALFTNYFSHSAIANGLTLITLYFAVRGRLIPAFAVNGAAFFVNAFIAVWNALPIGMILLFLLFTQQINGRKAVIDGAIGLVVFFVLSAPIVSNILSNPEFGTKTDFDMVAYYTQFYPFHFLFESISLREKIAAALVVLLAVSSFVGLGRKARPFLLATIGYIAVYLLGIFAPYFTHNASILNLHLLRVSTNFHLLAALGSLALAIRWLAGEDRIHARVLAPFLVAFVCTSRYLLLAAPFPIIVSLFPGAMRLLPSRWAATRFRIGYAAVICVAVAGVTWISREIAQNREETRSVSEWMALGRWVRANTPAEAIFLIPTGDIQLDPSKPDPPPQESTPIPDSAIFEYEAHRRVWVNFRRGAAVMWMPSYYKVWWPRISEIRALRSHNDRMAYARRNAIDYVVDFCATDQDPRQLFRTERLCLYFATGSR